MALTDNVLEVTDSVVIRGTVPEVYGCLWDAAKWPQLNPSVKTLEMLEESDKFQRFRMEIESDGRSVVTESTRTTEPNKWICYRQTKPPSFFHRHTGRWELNEEAEGTRITLTHTVTVDDERLMKFLQVHTVRAAREEICRLLSQNGLRTMRAIRSAIEKETRSADLRRTCP